MILKYYLEKLGAGKGILQIVSTNTNEPGMLDGALQFAGSKLKGHVRRTFMAMTVDARGQGGQRWAEHKLGWNRETIRKGQMEVRSGVPIIDGFSNRGRKKAEELLPSLLLDIDAIAKPVCQTDPTFRTSQLYLPLSAKNVLKQLLDSGKYDEKELPTIRTISTKLNQLEYRPMTVQKSKPKKKIKETDAIFERIHQVNREADETDGVLRISMDAKAVIKIGPFSRGGKNRRKTSALDHDFKPTGTLNLFGFYLPAHNDVHFIFSSSKITADFIVDALESLWLDLKPLFNPNTLVLNLDNGPENHSRRTQFMKRIIDFAQENSVTVKLAYYPPYHSKYNSVERVWGRLENHWNGELLDSEETVRGLASTMTWNGQIPHVKTVEGDYQIGKSLTAKEMRHCENQIHRQPDLPKWFVEIPPNIQ